MKNAGKAIKLFKKESQIEYLENVLKLILEKQIEEIFAMDIAASIPSSTVDSSEEYLFAEKFKELVDKDTQKILESYNNLKTLLEEVNK